MSSMGSSRKCAVCHTYKDRMSGKIKFITDDSESRDFAKVFNEPIVVGNIICPKCYSKYRRRIVVEKLETPTSSQELSCTPSSIDSSGDDPSVSYRLDSDEEEENLMVVELQFDRTSASHKYCTLCRSTSQLVTIPFEARIDAFTKKRIVIPKGNRCCPGHLIKNRFFEEELNILRVYSNSCEIEVSEVSKFLEALSVRCDSAISQIGDFAMPERRLIALTGMTWENVIHLRGMIVSMRNSEQRSVTQALVTFLCKLRTGNSNAVVAAILGLERDQQVSDFCSSIITVIEKDVLPTRFGIKAINRNELIQNHTSEIVKKLHHITDDQLVLIADGTYLRHQKSSDNNYQRKSYSGQKKVPLCKPFTVCTTDGFIVDVFGPFTANLNDAQIMKSLISERNGLKRILEEGDLFVLDRGFRDIVEDLKGKGFQVLMPASKGNRNQLTTEESNYSRGVTTVRWVVEATHGAIAQKFKLLHHQFDNKMLPNAASYCRIACFLQNSYGKRFNSSNEDTETIVNLMKEKMNAQNTLADEVEEGNWNRKKKPFQVIGANDILDFPELSERDLMIFFSGSYQMKQAVSYLAELMGDKEEFPVSYLKESADIIRFKVQSRHVSSKVYNCYVQYKPNSFGCSGILRYCCDCPNGRRTVGCCSHLAAIICYLSNSRYLSRIVRPAEILSRLFVSNDVTPVINGDSDED